MKKLTMAGLELLIQEWSKVFREYQGSTSSRLKALEERSVKNEAELKDLGHKFNKSRDFVFQDFDKSKHVVGVDYSEGKDSTVFVINKHAEPLKLPCTTCKHWRPYYATIRLWKFKSERDYKFDECAIGGGMDKKHLGLPVKSEFCLVANADQLCKFHSERQK